MWGALPFVPRLALGLPLALGLVLALLRWCVHGCPGWWAAPGKGLDLLIDLTCPEQCVLLDRQHGRLEGVALMHLLVNLPPCVALGNCQDVVLWRGKTAPDVLTIEPLVPALQVLPGDVELAELREREDAHEEGVAEHRVHPLELVASFGLAPLFHLILPVPAINRALLSGLPWPFSWLRECAYQVFHGDETDLASCAELELALHQLVASLKGQLGFANPLQLSPFAQDREIRGGVPGRVWPGSRCCMRPNSHGSSRVNHLEHAGRDQPGGHIRVVVVVGGEAQLPWRRLPCTVGRVPPGREVLHRDKALIRQCRLDEPRDAFEDHEVPGGLVELSHCVRVHSRNFLWWCHQLIWCRRHGVGGRDFKSQDKRSKGPLEPKWWPKWILIKSQDKRPPTVNALAQTLQSTTLVLLVP